MELSPYLKVKYYSINYFIFYTFSIDWKKELITEPRPTMAISVEDLLDIGAGKQKLEDFIPNIILWASLELE